MKYLLILVLAIGGLGLTGGDVEAQVRYNRGYDWYRNDASRRHDRWHYRNNYPYGRNLNSGYYNHGNSLGFQRGLRYRSQHRGLVNPYPYTYARPGFSFGNNRFGFYLGY